MVSLNTGVQFSGGGGIQHDTYKQQQTIFLYF